MTTLTIEIKFIRTDENMLIIKRISPYHKGIHNRIAQGYLFAFIYEKTRTSE